MNHAKTILILILIGVIVFLRECDNKHPEIIIDYKDRIVTDTIVDSVSYEVKKYVPYKVYSDTGSVDTLYYDVDTVSIIRKYFTTNIYNDTIMNDSLGFITVLDTVYNNKIVSRKTDIDIYRRSIVQTVTVFEKSRNKVFLGFGVAGSMNQFGFSANAGFLTKKDNLYTVSYDPFNKVIGLNMYWKLKLKK